MHREATTQRLEYLKLCNSLKLRSQIRNPLTIKMNEIALHDGTEVCVKSGEVRLYFLIDKPVKTTVFQMTNQLSSPLDTTSVNTRLPR